MPYNIFAYCTYTHRHAVAHAAGCTPTTSPPTYHAPTDPAPVGAVHLVETPDPEIIRTSVAKLFTPDLLRHRNLLYFGLHGYPDQPFWYGDNHLTAMSVAAFQGLDLTHTVVFVACCHFISSPFLPAILDCNPLMLVGGDGQNLTRARSLVGPHLLGFLLRRALQTGMEPRNAFKLAKFGLRMRTNTKTAKTAKQDYTANKDALHFKAYLPGHHQPIT